jgi:hypothetical protein
VGTPRTPLLSRQEVWEEAVKKGFVLCVGLLWGVFAWAQDASKAKMPVGHVNHNSSDSSTNTAFLLPSKPLDSASESNFSAADRSTLPS